MTTGWWALFLAGLAGVAVSLGGLARPDYRFTRPLFVLGLVLFTASVVLTLVVAGQT